MNLGPKSSGEVGQVGLGSAIAVLMLVIICAVSLVGIKMMRRKETELS